MSSLVELCSQSLVRLGADPISSLFEDSVESQTCALLWKPVLTRCLNRVNWRFAETDAELSRLLTTPSDANWDYQFAYPADYRRTVRVQTAEGSELHDGQYTRRGSLLLANVDRVHLIYSRSFTESEVSLLPEEFGQYFVCSLAYEAAPRITEVSSDVERMLRDTGLTLTAAIQADRESVPPKTYIPISPWRAVRYG